MSCTYAMLAVEGPSDQAVVEKALKLLGFSRFSGKLDALDPFWKTEARIVPRYPPESGDLYVRLPMPSILFTESRSIAIYASGGSSLATHVAALLGNHDLHQKLDSFGVIADADKKAPAEVAVRYRDAFQALFPAFPAMPGSVAAGPPKVGVFVLPDNVSRGVVEHLVLECGEAVYPAHLERARHYLADFSDDDRRQAKWAPFDQEKALIASIASLLKPGKTNTVSIADNDWITAQTQHMPRLAALLMFLRALLRLDP